MPKHSKQRLNDANHALTTFAKLNWRFLTTIHIAANFMVAMSPSTFHYQNYVFAVENGVVENFENDFFAFESSDCS